MKGTYSGGGRNRFECVFTSVILLGQVLRTHNGADTSHLIIFSSVISLIFLL